MEPKPGKEQLPEIIYIGGDLYSLYTTPLLPWLRGHSVSFDQRTPNCARGYIGRWKIEEETLWLTGVYAWRGGVDTGLTDLFGAVEQVEAKWFTGPLVVEPSAYAIVDGAYPKPTTIFVEAGRVVESERGDQYA